MAATIYEYLVLCVYTCMWGLGQCLTLTSSKGSNDIVCAQSSA